MTTTSTFRLSCGTDNRPGILGVVSVRVRRVTTTRAGGVSAPPYDTFNLGDHVGDKPAAVAANRHADSRKLSHSVRGELDWIVMKSLEKDRNRRYESPNSLAADVDRYLQDEPVLACPPSAGYRLASFCESIALASSSRPLCWKRPRP